MNRRLFEDLVVSTPAAPIRRRAAVLPFSIALHGGALALALLFPVLRQAEMPAPAFQRPVWEMPVRVLPPPVPFATVVRVARTAPARTAGPAAREVAPAFVPLPGPAVTMIEPEGLPTGEAPAPCFASCDGPLVPGGSGNGALGGTPDGDDTGTAATPPMRVGGQIRPPTRTVYVAPAFPEIAVTARVSAVVILDCTIDPTGHVTDVRVLRGHPLFDQAAVSAVRQWRYTATRLNGVPIPLLMTVTVHFTAGAK